MPARLRSLAAPCSLLLLLFLVAPAGAQGFTLVTDSMRLTFNGRVQTIFDTSDAPGFASTEWSLRRVRLEANVRMNRVVSGKISPEYAGSRVALRDAFVRMDLGPALQLTAGQAHRPFSYVTQMSAVRILPVERGVRIRGVSGARDHYSLVSELGYSERDAGLQAAGAPRGAPLGLSYAAGVFNGPLRGEAPGADAVQYVARLALRPSPRVRVGAAWSRRGFVRDPGATVLELRSGDAFTVDADLGSERGGPRLVAEAAVGDTDPFRGARFRAGQAWLAYRTGPVGGSVSAVEPLLRVSYGDPDVGGAAALPNVTGGVLVTPGVNLWLGGLNRVAVNWDLWDPEAGASRRALRAMFQLAF